MGGKGDEGTNLAAPGNLTNQPFCFTDPVSFPSCAIYYRILGKNFQLMISYLS